MAAAGSRSSDRQQMSSLAKVFIGVVQFLRGIGGSDAPVERAVEMSVPTIAVQAGDVQVRGVLRGAMNEPPGKL